MKKSAREKEKKYDDKAINMDWTPANSEREAFIDEHKRLEKDNGPNGKNYNKINSPRKNIVNLIKEKNGNNKKGCFLFF